MSTYVAREIACACGRTARHQVAEGVNIARSPKPREALLERTFQRWTCEGCQRAIVVESPFTYLDFSRKQFFGQFPRDWVQSWSTLERELRALYERNLVDPTLSPVARELGEGILLRVVFGLEALREKIVCFDAELDDAVLEVVKLELARSGGGWPTTPEAQLRLVAVDPDNLELARAFDGLFVKVPRAEYERAKSEPFAALRASLVEGPYVDLARLLPLG